MGLFGKKELCPICGRKIKGDILVKIRDNIALCKECSAMVNMDAALIPLQSVEDIKVHLAYRANNYERFENFETIQEAKAGTSLLRVDESQKVWYCIRNRKDKNPPIFEYGEIVGFQYLEDGQPVAEEEKKGVLDRLFGEKKEPVMIHSMKVLIDLDNPYTKSIAVETVGLNDEVKLGSLTYKSNRRSLEKIMEILQGMSDYAHQNSAATPEQDVTENIGEKSEQEIIEK